MESENDRMLECDIAVNQQFDRVVNIEIKFELLHQ